MKTKILFFIAFFIFFLSNVGVASKSEDATNDTIKVVCSPRLYDLTSNWVSEYSKLNQNAKIKVTKVYDEKSGNLVEDGNCLYILSDESLRGEKNQSVWRMMAGVDAVVPVVASSCVYLEELSSKGITSTNFALLFSDSQSRNWNTILKNGSKNQVNVYGLKGEANMMAIANFLKIEPAKVAIREFETTSEMIAELNKDNYGIGLCYVSNLIDPKTKNILNGVALLPIDRNSNGKIDSNEKIYNDLAAFLRGLWVGKYPKELYQSIYAVSKSAPADDKAIAFLSWVITDGQKVLNESGFGNLAYNLRESNLNTLHKTEVVAKPTNVVSVIFVVAMTLVLVIALFFVIDLLVQRLRSPKTAPVVASHTSSYLNEKSIDIQDGLYFDKSHTWAFMERDGLISIGIDDFLQHVTGPISKIRMKSAGEEVRKGETFLTIIQEGKQLNIKAPVSGKIKSFNEKLLSNAGLVNSSPYTEGWIYRIEPASWLRDTQFLIIAQGYREWIMMEFLHLKDFLAVALRANYGENAQVVLQDGGEIKDGVLKELSTEVLEDFQSLFLDSSK